MNENICRDISEDTLIAYADGDLPPDQAEQIKKHITSCEGCKTMLSALQRSLQVTQAIWQSDEAAWPKKRSFEKPILNRWLVKRLTTVAASILLVFGIGTTRWLLHRSNEEMSSIKPELTAKKIEEIEIEVQRAAVAAQMLAVADILAAQPGGEEYAVKRYNYIINSFAGRDESKQAKIRLQNLLERRAKQ